MSAKLIAKLRADLATLKSEKILPLLEKLENGQTLSDAESAQLAAHQTEGDQLDARLTELIDRQMAAEAAARRDAAFDARLGQPPTPEPGAGDHPIFTRPRSIGQEFTASPILADYVSHGATGTSGVFRFSLISSVDGNTLPMAGVIPVTRGQVQPTRTTPLLDACYIEMMSSNEYFWETWPLAVPVAGAVAEGAASSEATDSYTIATGSLGKAAHHIPITREGLEDNPSLQSKIEGRLMQGVRAKAEAKVAAAIVAATLPTAEHADGLLEAARLGMAQAVIRGFRPVNLIINPTDAATMDIDLLGKALRGAEADTPKWGMTVIEAPAVTAGTVYVGDLYNAVSVYARDEVQLFITDSHAAEFIDEKLRILARQRLSAHVTQPNALIECTVTVTP